MTYKGKHFPDFVDTRYLNRSVKQWSKHPEGFIAHCNLATPKGYWTRKKRYCCEHACLNCIGYRDNRELMKELLDNPTLLLVAKL